MERLKINIRKETLYINCSGSVIGDISFSIGDWYFPEKDWDDFVVVMLYWLTKELVELSVDKNKIVDAPFMEGCFKIVLTLDKQNQCNIKFIEGEKLAGDKEIVYKTVTVPFEEVKIEAKKACEVLLNMKKSKELDFKEDYEKLEDAYNMLLNVS